MFANLRLPVAADLHVHLRDGVMCDAITPQIHSAGVDTVFVMPNLVPPITTVSQALAYKEKLVGLAPEITFLMSLYLHGSLTRAEIAKAKKEGIYGIKAYPAGVTTHSAAGVVDWKSFYPIFDEMQSQDLVLNLHGECPSGSGITVLNAEERFLPTLREIHSAFPRLRIVLEHCSTQAAVEAVRACGDTVAGTITAHHLFLTVDDWAGNSLHWCKPAAKFPEDRAALLKAAMSGDGKFFFGSDSAPHLIGSKLGSVKSRGVQAAGVFTQPYVVALVLEALEQARAEGILTEEDVSQTRLAGFLSTFGRAFYGLQPARSQIIVSGEKSRLIEDVGVGGDAGDVVVSFLSGRRTWAIDHIASH